MSEMKEIDFGAVIERIQNGPHMTEEEIEKLEEKERESYIQDIASKIRKEYMRITPVKYQGVEIDDWQTPTDEHKTRKAMARDIFTRDYLQVWSGISDTGKTMLAFGIIKQFFKLQKPAMFYDWFKVSNMLHRESTVDENGEWQSSYEFIYKQREYDLVVIDDYNEDQVKDYILKGLFELIKIRERDRQKTIWITNLTEDDFKKSL